MLELKGISKSYFDQSVVKNVDLSISNGEFFSLLGPSGCGKTTLLRMLSGLETITNGSLILDGVDLTNVPAQARPFNMVFQKHALFPHLSVWENVAFGLKLKKLPSSEIQKRTQECLELVNMIGFKDRLPETLSGGQSQRVAIARALVNRPQVLLLDEPLSALDQKLREHMQTELKSLQRQLGLTFIYVTHDQEEAFALSDRVGVMNQGVLEQVSSPEELYQEPDTLFTAQFVGPMSSFEADLTGCDEANLAQNLIDFKFGNQMLKARPKKPQVTEHKFQVIRSPSHQDGIAMVRPERVRIGTSEIPDNYNRLSGKISKVVFKGSFVEVLTEVSDRCTVKAYINTQRNRFSSGLSIGDQVEIGFDPEDTFLFLGNTEK